MLHVDELRLGDCQHVRVESPGPSVDWGAFSVNVVLDPVFGSGSGKGGLRQVGKLTEKALKLVTL